MLRSRAEVEGRGRGARSRSRSALARGVDLSAPGAELDSEPAAPAGCVGSPGALEACDYAMSCSVDAVSKMPDYDVVVRRLVLELRRLYQDFGARPVWMQLCTDDALRMAGRYDPAIGLGVPSETDWGNNAGSVLFLRMAFRCGFDLFSKRDSMLQEQVGFATSGRGACNRRTN